MTLDYLDLHAGAMVDLECYAQELDMSPNILLDHILEGILTSDGDV